MAPAPDYKVCPQCRVEFLHSVQRCSDCDVPLVHRSELAPEPEPPAELPPASQLQCVRVAPLAWIRALSDGLAEGGVAHRVEPAGPEDAPEGQRADVFGDAQLFGLYVEAAQAAPAAGLDATIAAQVLPETAPELPEGEQDECPACGHALMTHTTECPDCGLVLG